MVKVVVGSWDLTRGERLERGMGRIHDGYTEEQCPVLEKFGAAFNARAAGCKLTENIDFPERKDHLWWLILVDFQQWLRIKSYNVEASYWYPFSAHRVVSMICKALIPRGSQKGFSHVLGTYHQRLGPALPLLECCIADGPGRPPPFAGP